MRFDVVSTAGAGMLVGLLLVAPKDASARQALENTREMGVHDSIYDLFPVNFKVFHKPGGLADAIGAGCSLCPAWSRARTSAAGCSPTGWRCGSIYPPFEMNGKTYIEGSAVDTLCFHGVLNYYERREKKKERLKPLDHIVIFDVLSSENIIRAPRTLYDAWVQSIIVSRVEIAKDDIELFKYRHKDKWADKWGKDGEDFLLQVKFDIPKEHWPYVLDWSYSNLSKLYDIGYEASTAKS